MHTHSLLANALMVLMEIGLLIGPENMTSTPLPQTWTCGIKHI
jgi:hypothetical protein